LDVTRIAPSTSKPDSGYPAIILIHGLGGNKNDMLYFEFILLPKGYLTLSYSVRGQGNSGGFATMDGERERQDLREIIAYLKKDPQVNRNRIGVFGASQGGIHAWMAAALDMGIRVAIPLIATANFANDLIPNNCIKTGLAAEMSIDTNRVRYYAPDRDRVMNFIYHDQIDSIRKYTNERDLDSLVQNIKIPVMILIGWVDYLFSPNAGISEFLRMKSPRKLYLGPFAHGGASYTDLPVALGIAVDWISRWLDYWLKGDNNGIVSEGDVMYASDVTWTHYKVPTWPPPNSHDVTFYFRQDGKLSLSMPQESNASSVFINDYRNPNYTVKNAIDDGFSGPTFQNALVATPAYFQFGPLASDMEFTGIPSLHVYTSGTGSKYQFNVQIFDVDSSNNGSFLTRGNYGVRDNQPGRITQLNFDANAYSHVFKKGRYIGINLTTVDVVPGKDLYMIPFFASSTNTLYHNTLYPSSISIPVVGTFTGVQEPIASAVPQNISLSQNYPNPFNPRTVIQYQVSNDRYVTLKVFDALGREVATLADGYQRPGYYRVEFDGKNLGSGIYFYQLRTGNSAETRRMSLLK
jgi:predicted acyl esterase